MDARSASGRRYKVIIALCLAWLSLPALAQDCDIPLDRSRQTFTLPEPRVALVVGNADYDNLQTTPNARNDALDLARELSVLGFDVVCGINLDRRAFINKLNTFRQRIDAAGDNAVSLLYYAGHGVQINNNNYLIPLHADITDKDRFGQETISLESVMHMLVTADNHHGSRFIILDACRDNPLGKGYGKPRTSFSIRGLYWAFGTGYGDVAYDGGGRNGLFTKHLLQHMHTKGATLEQVMKLVIAAVDDESDGGQVPETGGSLVRDFMFVPGQRISINTTYEDTPIWLKLIYWLGLALLLITGWFYYTYRQQTAWVKGIDLTEKLNIDNRVAEEIRHKTRLATNEIVGYVKQVRDDKLMGLITPKYDMVLGRNSNVNIVLDSDTVSGQHAQLGWDEEKREFWLEDLGSTNGTWWGKGKQLEPHRRYPLESGKLFYLADQETPMVVIAHADAK